MLRHLTQAEELGPVEVVIGTSELRALSREIATLCNEASNGVLGCFGARNWDVKLCFCPHVSVGVGARPMATAACPSRTRGRGLRWVMRKAGPNRRLAKWSQGANRVLHLAFREGQLLGCCSSTLQPPWTPWTGPVMCSCAVGRTCGHWGLLSVHPDAQGTGVASALIAAAERRLLEEGCSAWASEVVGAELGGAVQIEYEYTSGDPESERLLQWYEARVEDLSPSMPQGKCGFFGPVLPLRCVSRFVEEGLRRLGAGSSGDVPRPLPSRPSSRGRKRLTEESVYKAAGGKKATGGGGGYVPSVPGAQSAQWQRRSEGFEPDLQL